MQVSKSTENGNYRLAQCDIGYNSKVFLATNFWISHTYPNLVALAELLPEAVHDGRSGGGNVRGQVQLVDTAEMAVKKVAN